MDLGVHDRDGNAAAETHVDEVKFTHEGRDLSAWIQDLVVPDPTRQHAAGEAIMQMFARDGSTSAWTPRRGREHQVNFGEALREGLRGLGDRGAQLLIQIAAIQANQQEEWLRECDRAAQVQDGIDQAGDRAFDRVLARLSEAQDELSRSELERRAERVLCATLAREMRLDAWPRLNIDPMASFGRTMVLQHAGSVHLIAPSAIGILLDSGLTHIADETLANIGAEAVRWTDTLLERLDETDPSTYFPYVRALGSIGRDSDEVIGGLIERIGSRFEHVQLIAASVLEQMAPHLGSGSGDVVTAIQNALHRSTEPAARSSFFRAWVSAGRERSSVIDQLALELRTHVAQVTHDSASNAVGNFSFVGDAISSTAFVTRVRGASQSVIPSLVELYERFEEYDVDYDYFGERARLCEALGKFGGDAVPVVPRAIAYLEEQFSSDAANEAEVKPTLELLERIGPAASEALPVLRRWAEAIDSSAVESAVMDFNDWHWSMARNAILSIEGRGSES